MATGNVRDFIGRLTRGMTVELLGAETDRQLVERVLARGEEAALQALVCRHGPMVYRVCWRVLLHTQDAEDAFQATFLVLARRLRSVRRQASLASWLHGVAHRVALKARAQAAARQRREQRAARPAAGPPGDEVYGESRAVVDAELCRLPDKWRLPLVLCYQEGRTQDEAAAQLGWSKSTLRRRLDAARAALGRRLSDRGVTWASVMTAVLASDCVAGAAVPPQLVGATVRLAAAAAAPRGGATGLAFGGLRPILVGRRAAATALLLAAGGLAAALSCLGYGGPPARAAAEGEPPARRAAPTEADDDAPALKLTLSADRTVTWFQTDRRNARPVTLKATVTNVGYRPVGLDQLAFARRVKLSCSGPGVRIGVGTAAPDPTGAKPAGADTLVLPPGESWSPDWAPHFPGDIGLGCDTVLTYSLRQRGTYKLRLTLFKDAATAAGTDARREGCLESNDLELDVQRMPHGFDPRRGNAP